MSRTAHNQMKSITYSLIREEDLTVRPVADVNTMAALSSQLFYACLPTEQFDAQPSKFALDTRDGFMPN